MAGEEVLKAVADREDGERIGKMLERVGTMVLPEEPASVRALRSFFQGHRSDRTSDEPSR